MEHLFFRLLEKIVDVAVFVTTRAYSHVEMSYYRNRMTNGL